MKKIIFLLVLTNSFFCHSQNNIDNRSKLTKELKQIAKENDIVGFSTAIYNDKGTLYSKGFGYSDKEQQTPYTDRTIQNIGSTSKTFIAIALLKAQELGKLNLDDPINDHLPFKVINPYYPEDIITIRHITSHTSSIRDRTIWYGLNCYILKDKKKSDEKKKINFSNPDKMMSMDELYPNYLTEGGRFYKKKSFSKYKPGEHYEYSNIAAALGAYILEKATGENFKTFTQKHIFDPLEMNQTGWSFDDINLEDHTKIYTKSHKNLALYSLVTYPDGGLISSSNDIAKYASELIKGYHGKGTILSSESYKEAFTKSLTQAQIDKAGINENCGVFFDILDSGAIGHTGSDPGVVSFMYFDPETRIGKYLQINTDINKKGAHNIFTIWNKLKDYEPLLQKK